MHGSSAWERETRHPFCLTGGDMQTVYIDHSRMQLEREGEAILLRDRAGSRVTTLPTRAMERLILQGNVVCSTRMS